MQTLYTVGTLENEVKPGEPQRLLLKHFDQTGDLFFYLTYFLMEVTQYAETDASVRAGKHLPSYQDLHVNTKISDNEIIKKLKTDPVLIQQFEKRKTALRIDKELLKKIYQNLSSPTR